MLDAVGARLVLSEVEGPELLHEETRLATRTVRRA
jgi:hypothetical protein